jgi:hypothetical protein
VNHRPLRPASRAAVRPAIALALLAGAGAAAPATAAGAPPVELSATTTVVTSRTGWVDVVLREDALLRVGASSPDATVTGKGRLVELALYRQAKDTTSTYASLVVRRLPAEMGGATTVGGSGASEERCTEVPVPYTGPQSLPPCEVVHHDEVRVLEGRYRMRVLADGAPVRITLRMRGLEEGTTSIGLRQTLRSLQKPLPVLESTPTTATFGATGLTGDVDTAVLLSTPQSTSPATLRSACGRRDEGAPPPGAYSPPCPQGTAFNTRLVLSRDGEETTVFMSALGDAGDTTKPLGLGGSVTDPVGVGTVTALGVWFDPLPE